MTVAVDAALDDLNKVIGKYIEIGRKEPQQALAKQGAKLSFELASRMRAFAPAKGSVTEQRLAALQSGQGVRVRESVRQGLAEKLGAQVKLTERTKRASKTPIQGFYSLKGARFGKRGQTMFVRTISKQRKKLNFQALAVRRELALREQGRGFASQVSRIRGIDELAASLSFGTKGLKHMGRYNQQIAEVGLSVETNGSELLIVFGGAGTQAGAAMNTQKAQAATVESVNAIKDDVVEYLVRKLEEGAS